MKIRRLLAALLLLALGKKNRRSGSCLTDRTASEQVQ